MASYTMENQSYQGDLFSDARQDLFQSIDTGKAVLQENDFASNQHLFLTFQRIFAALQYVSPSVNTLVELGIGFAPFFQAVQAAFSPTLHVGLDKNVQALDEARRVHKTGTERRLALVSCDAQNPGTIPRLSSTEMVDEILFLHPNTINQDTSEVNQNMLSLLYNWVGVLKPDGIMIITTYDADEAEVIVSDPRLAPFIHLYGITGAFCDAIDQKPNGYVVVLRGTRCPEGINPIIWKREDYKDWYPSKRVDLYGRNLFGGSYAK